MAGKMMGQKGMRAARTPMKGQPGAVAGPTSTTMPKSVHIREANGGFIVSKHGGNADPFSGQDHVAKSFNAAIRLTKDHMGGGSTDATPEGDAEGSPEEEAMESKDEAAAEGDNEKPAKAKAKPAAPPKGVKKRTQSETY